jgi:hypothetical protein
MHRYRSGILVLTLLAPMFFANCPNRQKRTDPPPSDTQTDTGDSQPDPGSPSPKVGRKVEFPAGIRKIIVPNLLTSDAFRKWWCSQNTQPVDAEKFGGYACTTIHIVTLKVSGGTLSVEPASQPMEMGDCVMWEAKADDGSVVEIKRIWFVDRPAEAAPGKPVSDHPIGMDICTAGTARCALAGLLPKGTYRYSVRVEHNGVPKEVDPDLVVACGNPSGCDTVIP